MAQADAFSQIISCDWGTTAFRLWLVDLETGSVLSGHSTQNGIAAMDAKRAESGISEGQRQGYLLSYLESELSNLQQLVGQQLNGLPIVISGMASSTLGLQTLAYAGTPFRLDGTDVVWRRLEAKTSKGGSLFLISGVSSGTDMIRGEESELIGIQRLMPIAHSPDTDSVVVMPGTHSKHLRISSASISGIDTFLTGELFSILHQQGVLRNSLAEGISFEQGRSDFLEGVIASGEAALLNALFGIRARHLLQGSNPARNHHYLSGLLIGHELRAIPRSSGALFLCAGAPLAAPYQTAMEALFPRENCFLVPPDVMSNACSAAHAYLFRRFMSR